MFLYYIFKEFNRFFIAGFEGLGAFASTMFPCGSIKMNLGIPFI
jgi:hypothetical protein